MTIEEKIVDSVSILIPRGDDVWFSGGWGLHEKVKELVDMDKLQIVIDLSHIERINSIGLGMLVACLKTIRDKDGDLRLAGPNPSVKNVLGIVNLYTLLNIHDTPEEAVAGFKG
jgi:anti-sigma B factor antagonist